MLGTISRECVPLATWLGWGLGLGLGLGLGAGWELGLGLGLGWELGLGVGVGVALGDLRRLERHYYLLLTTNY